MIRKKTKHIGVVACSAEGAALCYRTICKEGSNMMGTHSHPEVTMHTYPLSSYMRYIEVGDWSGVADLMFSSAKKLARAGADFVICPDNTIHQAFDLVASRSPLPWIHIAEVVAAEASRKKFIHVGLLGTSYLMEGTVYPRKLAPLGIDHSIPSREKRRLINKAIFEELVYGKFTTETRAFFVRVISHLENQGCDAVILGCTEIPLLVTQTDSPLPILDSTQLLAKAALTRAAC